MATPIHSDHCQLLFESAPGCFLILLPDEKFTIAGVTDDYLRNTLTERDAIVGRPVFEVFPDNPDTPDAQSTANLGASLRRVVATRAPDTMATQRYDVPREDGQGFELRYWSPLNRPVLSPQGEILYIIHCVENVTEHMLVIEENARQRRERAELDRENQSLAAELLQHSRVLDERNAELLRSNAVLISYAAQAREEARRKDEFLAMLAHELRNPLAGISSALQLLELADALAPRREQARAVIRRQLGNLTRLVDDLLDMSRINRGVIELRAAPLDLRGIIDSALQTARGQAQRRGIRLAADVAPGRYTASGDATRLEQVLVNLLVNALKYSEPATEVTVRMAREQADGQAWARIDVVDQGRGIPPERLSAIFDLFVQVDTSIDRGRGGLGLGLTLVRALVDMHGGQVSAHSDGPGCGSTFSVRLPLAEVEPAAAGPGWASPDGARRSVLVVEDNHDARDTLVGLLDACGFSVAAAACGEEGLALLLRERPQAAIVDLGLPGLDGFELARRARASEHGERLVLLALSGYGDPATTRRALAAGFDAHLVKPLDVSRLPALIDEAGRRRG